MDTKEFLEKCKEVGYKHVAIGVQDKRVPASMVIEKQGERKYSKHPSSGDYWGEMKDEDGFVVRQARVVCASPNLRAGTFPVLWQICKDSSLTAGCDFCGGGLGECHGINRNHELVKGYYNLAEDLDEQIKDNQAA